MDICNSGSWFAVHHRALLPHLLYRGRLRRLSSGLTVEASAGRHDIILAEINNTAASVSVGIMRSARRARA